MPRRPPRRSARPVAPPTGAEADEEAAARRRDAALAGFHGDLSGARRAFDDPSPKVRAAALSSLQRLGALDAEVATRAVADPSPVVRRRIAELAGKLAGVDYRPLLEDAHPEVTEAGCFAIGEQRDAAALDALVRIATGHREALCREAAVAALGAIGPPGATGGVPALVSAMEDRPTIRRRAALALSAFHEVESERDLVTGTLERALQDRDWQVRQAAEDLLGVSGDEAS